MNNQIRAKELRVIDNEGNNYGVLGLTEALELAEKMNVDLLEISPMAVPPVAKLMEYGKFMYEQKKKAQKAKAGIKISETKSIQVKVGTGDNDLALKARQASKWLAEGHRIKVELFLRGRSKFMDEKFLKDRIERFLNLITEKYKVAEDIKKVPKGMMLTIEREK
ncbi:translation initiation factor IF-3 [Candidatus Nomurabacteria bacterium RIFCSPHIGHO2_02_FULL_38_15]|uniref:Translation initiation factor IF-3 n=1 Tax=Candidatus Nomurabacteria bacterium RIFCSPHIGHO2_02_FULL_38_15 TaxID=1801752 RepID=A0A1F6VQB4_9BACT|nr:MAG: translation initiation factor IF-3 [Candidatus Nomurabacteria bacterium RIFCSPHIGHO2_02_FULL_38_15]